MNVFISPLGSIPGLVTAAYYGLNELQYGKMNRVVTLRLNDDLSRLCEREVEAELERAGNETGHFAEFEPHTTTVSAVRNSADIFRLRRVVLEILRAQVDAGHQTFLSVSGGGDILAAVVAMAAQVLRPTHLLDVFLDEELEWKGDIITLLRMSVSRRRSYLRPRSHQMHIVEIPLLSLEKTIDLKPFQARIFESAVGEYVATQLTTPYPQIQYKFYPDYLHGEGLGEIDVLATRQMGDLTEVLLCECFMREDPVPTNSITRLANKREKVIEVLDPLRPECVKAWLVTTSGEVEDADHVLRSGIEVYQAQLPQDWQMRADWSVEGLTPLLPSGFDQGDRLP